MAVAPLFLFPFCASETVATVVLWLAFPAAVWLLQEPSLRDGEMLYDARRRVLREIVRDPLFWLMLVLVVLSGVRALNTGIAMAYDAENSKWFVSEAKLPILPGSVDGAGYLAFAATVALTLLLMGCRHSLGLSGRMAYLFVSSTLAGLAATIAIVAALYDNAPVLAAMAGDPLRDSLIGPCFALHLFGGTVALLAAFEHRWNLTMPLFAFAIGGSAAGTFAFSSVFVSTAVAIAEIVLLTYVFAYACRSLKGSGEFKFLVVAGIAFTLGGLLVAALMPEKLMDAKVAPYLTFDFLPQEFRETRALLSATAFKTWLDHLWIGTGLASFPLDFRFAATPDEWTRIATGAEVVPNGWWMLLVERGVVGAVMLGLPIGFLVYTWVRRLIGGVRHDRLPHPACAFLPLALVMLAVIGCYDGSFLRAEVLMALWALLAVAAKAFPQRRE